MSSGLFHRWASFTATSQVFGLRSAIKAFVVFCSRAWIKAPSPQDRVSHASDRNRKKICKIMLIYIQGTLRNKILYFLCIIHKKKSTDRNIIQILITIWNKKLKRILIVEIYRWFLPDFKRLLTFVGLWIKNLKAFWDRLRMDKSIFQRDQ